MRPPQHGASGVLRVGGERVGRGLALPPRIIIICCIIILYYYMKLKCM